MKNQEKIFLIVFMACLFDDCADYFVHLLFRKQICGHLFGDKADVDNESLFSFFQM